MGRNHQWNLQGKIGFPREQHFKAFHFWQPRLSPIPTDSQLHCKVWDPCPKANVRILLLIQTSGLCGNIVHSNYIQFIPTYNTKCYLDSNGTQSIGNNPMAAGFSCNRTTSSSRHFTFAFTPDWFLGWSWGWVSTVQVYHTYTVEVSKNGGCPKPVVSRLKYATKWFHEWMIWRYPPYF